MTDSWLTEFEARLELLERAARDETSRFSDLHALAMTALQVLATVTELSYWLVRPSNVETLTEDGQSLAADADAVIREAAGREFLIERTDQMASANSSSAGPSGGTFYAASPIAEQLTFVMGTEFSAFRVSESSYVDGSRAIAEIVSSVVSRHLLSQYEERLQAQAGLLSFANQLSRTTSIDEVASVVAQDGAAIVAADRVSVLVQRTGGFHVMSSTGVQQVDNGSSTVRGLVKLVTSIPTTEVASGSNEWWTAERLASTERDVFLDAARSLFAGGTSGFRIVPVHASDIPREDFCAAIVIETFDDKVVPDEQQLQAMLAAAGPAIAKQQLRAPSTIERLFSNRTRLWMAGLAIAAAILILVPVKFEVEVVGRIVAANQRHMFAPENGTIDDVFFEHEGEVEADALLLQISNSELELQQQQIQGEIDTVEKRLAVVRVVRPDQLTGAAKTQVGEKQQLEARRDSLQEQKKLIDQQIALLAITSPFKGTVFRYDPQQELKLRPVQRGQRLLEIVPHGAAWQLELPIPSDVLSYVTTHRDSESEPLAVRYVIRSVPERDWGTTLSEIDHAVQIQDGRLICLATATLAKSSDIKLRPGTSVTARIECGRRCLGFVWFREVIEFWNQFRFAWL